MRELALGKLDTGWRLAVGMFGLLLVLVGGEQRAGVVRAVGVIMIIVSLIPFGRATRVYAQSVCKIRLDLLLALRRRAWWVAATHRLVEHPGEAERLLAAARARLEEVTPPRGAPRRRRCVVGRKRVRWRDRAFLVVICPGRPSRPPRPPP